MTFPDDPIAWQIESSEYVSRLPWFTVRKDSVRMANGGHIPDYFVFEYPNWINVVAVTTEGQLVLIRQYRHGLGAVHYELCAGVVEPFDGASGAEAALITAQRELLEETGYGGGDWSLLMTLSANPGTHSNLTYAFLATGVTQMQAQELEDTEEISVHVVSPQEALAIVDRGEMIQSLHVAPLLRYLGKFS
jgi:8-oxo-dGTP pyrophosphatase MutT (NUDIX family)